MLTELLIMSQPLEVFIEENYTFTHPFSFPNAGVRNLVIFIIEFRKLLGERANGILKWEKLQKLESSFLSVKNSLGNEIIGVR